MLSVWNLTLILSLTLEGVALPVAVGVRCWCGTGSGMIPDTGRSLECALVDLQLKHAGISLKNFTESKQICCSDFHYIISVGEMSHIRNTMTANVTHLNTLFICFVMFQVVKKL